MRKVVLLFLAGLSGSMLAGCASVGGEASSPSGPAGPAPTGVTETAEPEIRYSEFDPEVLYLLMGGEVAAQRGRFDVTLSNYVKAAKLSRDLGVTVRAMRISQSLNADNAQRQLADVWLELEPDNLEAHRIAAIQGLKAGKLETALFHMEAIMQLGGDADFDSLAAMAGRLPPEQQHEMLNLYKQLGERHPDTPEIDYGTALLMKVTGQEATGLKLLEELLAKHPNFQPAIILKGDLLYQTGQKIAALDFLLKNTRRFPENRQMGTLYGRMLINEGEMQAAQDEFQRLVTRFPDIPGLRLSYALVALENGETGIARKELHLLLAEGQHENEAYYYLGRIADDEQKIEEAINFYDQVETGTNFLPALARASTLRAEQGDLEQALANLHRIRDINPGQAENFWLLEINLLTEAGQKERAVESANTALAHNPDSIRILYARAMLLDSMEQPGPAEQDLRHLISLQPDNAVALNALGYILTIRSDRFDEARTMIEQALALDPENPAILDSMGWVLFRQGETASALDYLERAYKAFPDPEVAAHFGEALWQSGQKSQARIIWKEGLAADPEHELLLETILRLTGDQNL